jgi:hypothetical protein
MCLSLPDACQTASSADVYIYYGYEVCAVSSSKYDVSQRWKASSAHVCVLSFASRGGANQLCSMLPTYFDVWCVCYVPLRLLMLLYALLRVLIDSPTA